MAYQRIPLIACDGVSLERVQLLERSHAWSPDYETAQQKFVVPLAGYLFARTATGDVLVDATVALDLPERTTYRMRQPILHSVAVVSLSEACASSLSCCASRASRSSHARAALRTVPVSLQWILRSANSQTTELAAEESLMHAAAVLTNAPDETRDAQRLTVSAARSVSRAREFLCEHFRDNISLQSIAHAAHSSPFHLARAFKSRYGITLFAQRERLRIVAAMQALASRSGVDCNTRREDMTALALELGYASHSHFSAAFKRATGYTPSSLRRTSIRAGI
jgi:AraC family transcriptional regulator